MDKKGRTKDILFLIVTVVLSIIGLVCAYIHLHGVFSEYKAGEDEYNKLSAYVVPKTIESDEKETMESTPYDIDFESLKKVNEDIIGWIIIDGTEVNYPIVKSKDNEDYLHVTFEGKKNSAGTIFADCDNASDFSDFNTILYGHNMKNGSMFKTVAKYRTEEFFRNHPKIWVCTPSWQKSYDVISFYETSFDSDAYQVTYSSKEEYTEHLVNQKALSLFKTSVELNSDRKIITLSTCAANDSDLRYVLVVQEKDSF